MRIRLFLLFFINFLLSTQTIEKIDFHKNGAIKKEEHYVLIKGKKDILKVVYYYENGKIKSEQYYNNSKKNGPYISYHDNQQKYIVGKYNSGFKNGKWTEYDMDGWLKKITTYKNGRPIKKVDFQEDTNFTDK